MKLEVVLCLLAFYAVPLPCAAGRLSPVSRVVELLKGLSSQIEKEGKAEEDLYESYVCWAKSVISQKTASNAEAASKIDSLETYIADLDAGRVDFTGERATLEKDIAELMADLEEAKALRSKEHEDFLEAESEMVAAETALEAAAKVLDDATKDHKTGTLLAVRATLGGGMEAVAKQQSDLKRAVALGEKFLSQADAHFLKRLLTGEVPEADWKKLNRKATFKMSYKARSFKIQDVLANMLATFKANLADARGKEAAALKTYEKLKSTKSDQLQASQDALAKSEQETGARGQSRQDAQDEVDTLKGNVAADDKFIDETEKALEAKKGEWKTRSEIRANELEAISKAIYILHNDDARDLMKKSFASQEGFLFLQVKTGAARQAASAIAVLRSAARRTNDGRLLDLAIRLSKPSAKLLFKPIIESIDKMVLGLKKDEAVDLQTKEDCEKGRMDDTRSVALLSRSMDEATDLITKLTSEIEELERKIESFEEKAKETFEELKEAEKLRGEEHASWKITDKEDGEAAETVQNAKDVLTSFYDSIAFVQRGQRGARRAPEVTAGEAPPPPPTTWGGDYGGKTGESDGIVSILGMVKEDILKDKAKAAEEEKAAAKAFIEFEKQSKDEIKDLKDEISNMKGEKGDKAGDLSDTKIKRGDASGELASEMKSIKEIAPNCEYFAVNYKLRVENRAIEMDGLTKSKAILEGGDFA